MTRSAVRLLLCCCFVLTFLPGCGGNGVTNPPPPPTTLPACTRTVVFSGSAGIPKNTLDFESFTTTSGGRLDVTLDWTVATHRMVVGIVQPVCTFEQFQAGSCNFLLQLSSPPKPLTGSVPNTSAGTFGLLIGNPNSVQESFSVQVVLSSSTCPAASSTVTANRLGEGFGLFGFSDWTSDAAR